MKLIYLGNIYHYTPPPAQPYRKPKALNWRYQIPGEEYGGNRPDFKLYRYPRAINWRYQLNLEV